MGSISICDALKRKKYKIFFKKKIIMKEDEKLLFTSMLDEERHE